MDKCLNCGHDPSRLHRGTAINQYVSILSELLSLSERIPELEKTSRRTPPKHMFAEKVKVEQAKVALIQARERKATLETERDTLLTKLQGKPYPTDQEYLEES